MKVVHLGLLILTACTEANCSGSKVLNCQGTYILEQAGHDTIKSPTVIGFKIERPMPIFKLFSNDDWKGLVNLSYSSQPYGRTFSGGGVMPIKTDNDSLFAVGSTPGKAESIIFDPVDDVVTYENDHDKQVETISGKCRS